MTGIFIGLPGRLPPALSNENPDLAIMVLTLNETGFTRLPAPELLLQPYSHAGGRSIPAGWRR